MIGERSRHQSRSKDLKLNKAVQAELEQKELMQQRARVSQFRSVGDSVDRCSRGTVMVGSESPGASNLKAARSSMIAGRCLLARASACKGKGPE